MMDLPNINKKKSPHVWVITDGTPGNFTQAAGLVDSLGWSYVISELNFTRSARFNGRLPGLDIPFGLAKADFSTFKPPWPDLVIAVGRRTIPVARWIWRKSSKRTKLILLGRAAARMPDMFDLTIAQSHWHLPSHPKKLELLAPLTQINLEKLQLTSAESSIYFANSAAPRLVLLVGGTISTHALGPELAKRMIQQVNNLSTENAGSLFVLTSRRTDPSVIMTIKRQLTSTERLVTWSPQQQRDTVLGFMAWADVLIVTGDSESMLAEATATGKPVYIYPLSRRPLKWRKIFSRWAAKQAQQSKSIVAKLFRVMLRYGLLRPTRDLEQLHRSLIEAGYALPFGAPLQTQPTPPLDQRSQVVERINALFKPEVR